MKRGPAFLCQICTVVFRCFPFSECLDIRVFGQVCVMDKLACAVFDKRANSGWLRENGRVCRVCVVAAVDCLSRSNSSLILFTAYPSTPARCWMRR